MEETIKLCDTILPMEALRSNSPEMKEFEVQPFEVINIPEPRSDYSNSQYSLQRREISGMLEQKIFYLQDVLEYYESHNDFPLPNNLRNYINVMTQVFAANKDKLPDYVGAETVENLIRKKIPIKEINISENLDTRDKEIINSLTSHFEKSKGNKVCISTSHGATLFALKAVHEAKENESAKIGVIVFDNHVDIYNSGSSGCVHKGNFFRLLGNSGIVETAVFIGGIDESELISNENSRLKRKSKTTKYDQIGVDCLNQDGKTDRLKLLAKLDEVIRYYKESGITNIVFSIDIDVLRAERMGYTGFEFNPINVLEHASSLNDRHEFLYKDPSKLTLYDLYSLNVAIGNTNWSTHLKYHSPVGLALGDIGVSLDAIVQNCKNYGLDLGVKLIGGGTYFGDVVEMSGPDYKGRTTRSSVALLKRIERIVQG